MKPALEWINAVGEAVMTAAFAGAQPPGTEVEDIVKAIQADAATDATELARLHDKMKETAKHFETAFRVVREENDRLTVDLADAKRERDEARAQLQSAIINTDYRSQVETELATLRTALATAQADSARFCEALEDIEAYVNDPHDNAGVMLETVSAKARAAMKPTP